MKREIGFVCLGQAGGNIGSVFEEKGFNVLYINTSPEDLGTLKSAKYTYHIPNSEGCAKNRDVAKGILAKSLKDIVRKIKLQFRDETFIGVIFSAGGGTGSGMGPALIDTLVYDEFVDEKGVPTKTVFAVTILPDLKEAVTAKMNSYQCCSELFDIVDMGATFVINNAKPDSSNVSYNKYKMSLNRKFVSAFCSFLEVRDRITPGSGAIDLGEIKLMLKTPGMMVISVTPRKTSTATIVEDLKNSAIFAPLDTDLEKRTLKYVMSSTVDDLDSDLLVREFGSFQDEFQAINQEKNVVILNGLRPPIATLNGINESMQTAVSDLRRMAQQRETDTVLDAPCMAEALIEKSRRRRILPETGSDATQQGVRRRSNRARLTSWVDE